MKKLNIQYSHFPTSFIYICSSFLQKTALKSSFSNSFCARRRLWIFCSRQIPCCCSPCPLPFLNINRMNQEKNAVTTAIQTDHPSYSQINNFLEYIWISLLCIKLLQNHHQCHPFQFFHGMLFSCPPPCMFITYDMNIISGIIKVPERFPFSFAHEFLNSFHLRWNGPRLISAFDFTFCENKIASEKPNLNVWNLKEQNQTSLFPKVAILQYINMIALPMQYSQEKKIACFLSDLNLISKQLMEHFD